MQKRGFPISTSLDKFKSLYGTTSGTVKPLSSLSARQTSDSVSSGSFANLKLTAGFDTDFALISFFSLSYWLWSEVSIVMVRRLFLHLQRNWWKSKHRWRLILILRYDMILICYCVCFKMLNAWMVKYMMLRVSFGCYNLHWTIITFLLFLWRILS